MPLNEKKIWFPTKRYGWGWGSLPVGRADSQCGHQQFHPLRAVAEDIALWLTGSLPSE